MFNANNFTRTSMPYNCGTVLLQDGSTAGGPSVYTYISTIDDITTIQAANYFAGAIFDLDLGDVIFCNGSDANLILGVSAIDKSAGTISTEVYMATEMGGVTARQVQQGAFNIGIDTGTADNYIVNLDPAVTSLTDGLLVAFQPLNPNATTTPTLQINSLPPQSIELYSNFVDAVEIGDIQSNGAIAYLYYSVNWGGFILLNPYISTAYAGNVQNNIYNHGTDTGTADVYIVDLTPGGSINGNDGTSVSFIPAHTNTTTTPTLNVNGQGNVNIYLQNGSSVQAGDLDSTKLAYCIYSQASSGWLLMTPVVSTGGGGVTPVQIQDAAFVAGIDSGVADAYVVTLSPSAIFTANNGTAVSFSPLNANTISAPTLAVNGATALPIVLPNNTPLQAGDIAPGSVAAYCIYSNGVWMLMNAIVSGSAVTPVQVQENAFCSGVDSGVADAYVVTLTPGAEFTPQNGSVISFIPLNNNTTTTPNVVVNGGSSTPIFLLNDTPMLPGDLNNSIAAYLIYDAAEGAYYLVNPFVSYATAQAIQNNGYNNGVDTGVADAYVVTLTPDVAFTPANGSVVAFTPENANTTTTPTVAINGGAPASIVTSGGGAVLPGDIGARVCYLVYSGSTGEYILLNANNSTFNLLQMQSLQYIGGVDTGVAANVYVYSNTYTSSNVFPNAGLLYIQNPNATNTGASTLNVNGVDYPIVLQNQNPLTGGEILVIRPAFFLYEQGGSYILLNPAIEDIVAKSIQFSPSTSGIIGVTDASNAGAAIVGEYISSAIAIGSPVSATSGTPINVTSISLTAGDWDISGCVGTVPGVLTTTTKLLASISLTTGTSSDATMGANYIQGVSVSAGNALSAPIATTRQNISSTTTFYLVADTTFAISTLGLYGFIGARRVR